MTGIILAAVMGLILLMVFTILGLQGPPKTNPDTAATTALSQMVSLAGNSFIQGDRLFNDAEYRLLRSSPALYALAASLQKDRRELVLLWIDGLLVDLKALWRFRRFIVQYGAPTNLGEEWTILSSFVTAVIFLNLLRFSVLTLGPFAFTRAVARAHRPVSAMSRAAAIVLGRIPPAGWPDIERAWISATT